MMIVAFYSDYHSFGGHEKMAMLAAAELSKDRRNRVYSIFNRENFRLAEEIDSLNAEGASIVAYPVQAVSRRLNAVAAPLSFGQLIRVRALLRTLRPEVAVIAQGRIELGLTGLIAARSLGLRTVSYIPMAHTLSEMGKDVLVPLRERLLGYWYRLPTEFITISEATKSQLGRYKVSAPITVVPNCPREPWQKRMERSVARTTLGLPADGRFVGLVGRLDARQKGQDWLVEFASANRHRLGGTTFAIVGDGPDLSKVRRMVAEAGLSRAIVFLGHRSDMLAVYSALDCLIVPSRYEGVPLVVMEALAAECPVVGSDLPEMREVLPPDRLFDLADKRGAWVVLNRAMGARVSPSDAPCCGRMTTVNEFRTRFAEALRLAGAIR